MSLQLAAQHLADKGRGPDTTLVHMSNKEVKSLNDLAMAHGGQLTINPETGLPEAGFLSMILPMVAGAALGPAGMGLTAMQAGLAVGAGSYLMNPRAGLMGALSSGLGGYGGAGLAGGLSNLATSEAGSTTANAMTAAADEAQKNLIAERMQQQAAEQAAMSTDMSLGQAGAANAANVPTPDYLRDYGIRGQYTADSAPFLNSPGGMNITTPGASAAPIGQIQPPNALDIQTVRDAAMESAYRAPPTGFDAVQKGLGSVIDDPTKLKQVGGGSYAGLARMGLSAAAPVASQGLKSSGLAPLPTSSGRQVVPHYRFNPGMVTPTPAAGATGTENTYFQPSYMAVSDEEAKQLYPGYAPAALPAANGGLMGYAGGGPVEQMSNDNAIGANTGFPQAYLHNNAYATPYQTPISQNVLMGAGDVSVDPYTGEQRMAMGGLSDARYNLGGYSDGGRLLRGPGDGVSDSIPAVIGKKQPARLADGEFVVPARIVSELGNGSTEAGARKLYAMLDRVQASRKRTVGKGKVAKNNRADKYLPA